MHSVRRGKKQRNTKPELFHGICKIRVHKHGENTIRGKKLRKLLEIQEFCEYCYLLGLITIGSTTPKNCSILLDYIDWVSYLHHSVSVIS